MFATHVHEHRLLDFPHIWRGTKLVYFETSSLFHLISVEVFCIFHTLYLILAYVLSFFKLIHVGCISIACIYIFFFVWKSRETPKFCHAYVMKLGALES